MRVFGIVNGRTEALPTPTVILMVSGVVREMFAEEDLDLAVAEAPDLMSRASWELSRAVAAGTDLCEFAGFVAVRAVLLQARAEFGELRERVGHGVVSASLTG